MEPLDYQPQVVYKHDTRTVGSEVAKAKVGTSHDSKVNSCAYEADFCNVLRAVFHPPSD